MGIFALAKTFFLGGKSNIYLYVLIGLVVVAVAYLGYDYADTKSENKVLNQKVIKKDKALKKQKEEHIKELAIVSDLVAEQVRQNIELEYYNELLKKQSEVKSNVKTDDKNFKSRNIVGFTF